jgi:hypothetical protein
MMPSFISPSEMKRIFEEKEIETSSMNKMVSKTNPDKILPSSFGKKWFCEENDKLLIELEAGLSFEEIAKLHDRSIGGILSRCKENAFQMYLKNLSIKEIIQKVKLTEEEIKEFIKKKEIKQDQKPPKIKQERDNKEIKQEKVIEQKIKQERDIKEIKQDIIEIKKNLKELIEMIKAIYEFEDS